jgi:hypothetical protein
LHIAAVTETCAAEFAEAPAALHGLADIRTPLLDVEPAAVLQLREAMRRVASAYVHASAHMGAGNAGRR